MTDIQNLKRALETDSGFEREFTPEVCAELIQRIEELEAHLASLPKLPRYDCVLVDDDHNGLHAEMELDADGACVLYCHVADIAAQSTKDK